MFTDCLHMIYSEFGSDLLYFNNDLCCVWHRLILFAALHFSAFPLIEIAFYVNLCVGYTFLFCIYIKNKIKCFWCFSFFSLTFDWNSILCKSLCRLYDHFLYIKKLLFFIVYWHINVICYTYLPGEDGHEASSAGQMETFLGVQGEKEVMSPFFFFLTLWVNSCDEFCISSF